MKPQLIITHPGSAHFDEMTAISLILAEQPETAFTVARREPAPEELEDPVIWVIDIGNRHEPEKLNFDHHQSLECPASFVLVADYLGLIETLAVMPWWHFKDEVDRFGPVRSSAKFNAGDDMVNRNPVEDWLVDRFAADPEGSLPLLRDFGGNLIARARMLKKQLDYWAGCRRLDIAGVTAIIGETRESTGIEEYRRYAADPPDIVISKDRRSNGWRLFRYDGAPVDFTLIAVHPEIAFAHQSGFMAKTKDHLPEAALIDLVSRAVIKEAA